MKIAFIHNEKKIMTGAHYINDLILQKIGSRKHKATSFYPETDLIDTPLHLKGLANILFFYSLLVYKEEVLKYDIVQGTTYTSLPFLAFGMPVVSHFGSTTAGFLKNVPLAKNMGSTSDIMYELKKKGVIDSVNYKTRKPLDDIADIETYVATRASKVIATSEIVKQDLLSSGVPEEKISVIYNAVEDYWFDTKLDPIVENKPSLVFLGRLGGDAFNLKLKGFDRLADAYRSFPDLDKTIVCITTNKKLSRWILSEFKNHKLFANLRKDLIPATLKKYQGGILLVTSRYEGFSLSLIEGMSQGLVPVAYPVGVVPEVIKNGENGFIVNNQDELKKAIQTLANNFELRKKMALNAYKTAKKFNADKMADEMLKLYADVIKKKEASK